MKYLAVFAGLAMIAGAIAGWHFWKLPEIGAGLMGFGGFLTLLYGLEKKD